MTDASRRMVLGVIALGLGAMFAFSLSWRMGDHPITRQNTRQAAQAAPAGEPKAQADAKNQAHIMELMQKLQNNPNDAETLLHLAQEFAQEGNLDAAKNLAERAYVAAPSDHRPSYLMGVLLARQEKWPEAAENLERSLRIKDDAAARYSLAVIYRYHLNQEAKAREYCEIAAKICEDPALASMIRAEMEK